MAGFCIGFILGGVFGMAIIAVVAQSDFDEIEDEDP